MSNWMKLGRAISASLTRLVRRKTMSLLKHLLLSVTVIILTILLGTGWFSVDSARQYLSTQLPSAK